LRRCVALALLIGLTFSVRPSSATPDAERVTVSPGAGFMLFSERGNADDGLLYGGGFGLMLGRRWGFEGLAAWGSTNIAFDGPESGVVGGEDVDVRYIGFDVRYHMGINRRIHPYVTAGWASVFHDPAGTGNQRTSYGFEAGGGVMLRLREGRFHRTSLRLDARDVWVQFGEPLINNKERGNNFLVSAMLQFEYGDDWHKDTDGDGVIDRMDDCPDTERGVVVDARGCPIDSDGDGVFDGPDRCAGTPAGAVVDSLGCPIDTDGDGIFDGIDQCPGTPQGAVVDERGCPIDSDGDGVFDGLDECPGTPSAVRVDERGCPTVDSEQEAELYEAGRLVVALEFDSGKSELKPGSSAQLRVIADAMRKWPDLRIEVGGHTDNRGSEANNVRLSQERADAVKAYLVDTFTWITGERLTAVGYGPARPIADNATEEGRAQNRRVEFEIQSGGPRK
jgi:OmpA-OmpF porin, OOP family